MNERDPRLERYLSSLEASLKPFPVSDRAEIITEIKSHVLSALERDSQASVDSILAALGEPEIVANRYLMERGMKPAKPPISPIVRWMVIGFLGTIAMVLLFAGFVVSQFRPIVKIDEKSNQVEILGGMIKVDGDKDRVSIKGVFDGDFKHSFSGSQPMKEGESVDVKFTNGRVEVNTNGEPNFEWECRGSGDQAPEPMVANGATTLDLSSLGEIRCELSVPKNAKLKVVGVNGRISLGEADYEVDVDLQRGRVEFGAADGAAFKYDVKVDAGSVGTFESSTLPTARSAKIHVGAGRIDNEK